MFEYWHSSVYVEINYYTRQATNIPENNNILL